MWSAGFLPGCLCSLTAISIERKSRRGALAVYMLNQVFIIFRAGKKREILL